MLLKLQRLINESKKKIYKKRVKLKKVGAVAIKTQKAIQTIQDSLVKKKNSVKSQRLKKE